VGAELWAILTVVGLPIVIATAYFQGAVILSHAAWVMGALFTVVGYGGGFLFANPVRRIGFERQEILDAKSLPGYGVGNDEEPGTGTGTGTGPAEGDPLADGGTATASADVAASITDQDFVAADQYAEELYRDLPEVRLVRTDQGFKPVTKGIRPFFARLFTTNEHIDLSSFRTRVIVEEGRLNEIIHVDPESEEAVRHLPARLRRALPWDELARDEETGEIVADWKAQAIAAVMTGGILLGPGAAGFWVFDNSLGVPAVGAALGIVATVALAYTAEKAVIDFEEAPIHDMPARNTVTYLQRAHKEAKDIRDAREAEYREKAKTAREARDEREREKRTVTDEALETLIGESPTDTAARERDERRNGDGMDASTNGHATDDGDDDREGDDGDE